MFNKKTISLAVAVAATGLSVNALADFDVTDPANTEELTIANESVSPTTTGVQPVGVGNTTGALDVTGEIGVGVPSNDQIFVRFDWTGGEILTALPDDAVTVDTTGSTSLTGGLAEGTSAIFGVLAPAAGFAQDATVTLDMQTTGIGLTGSTMDVRMRVYTDQGEAISGSGASLSDQSATGVISLGNALNVAFTEVTATAEVEENFLEFDPSGNTVALTGALGYFSATASTGFVLASDLTTATFANLVNAGTVSSATYEGNFGFNTASGFYLSADTGGACNATGSTALTPDTASYSTATITDISDGNMKALCAVVNGTDETIPNATYSADVTLAHAVTDSSPSSTTASDGIGEIDRNGTTVEVAYVTTFADYNQRLLLNSRSNSDTTYTITFRTEDGVTATPTALATGTLPAGQNLVMKLTDLVTFTGGSRGSATVTVVAPDSDIDVATTQVNLADKSTDTVYWSVK